MSNFNEYKAKKEGKITPKVLLDIVNEEIEADRIESIVIVSKYEDGYIHTGWTDMYHTEAIGLMEIAKNQVMKDLWDEFD